MPLEHRYVALIQAYNKNSNLNNTPASTNKVSRGSGYLVTEELVLTARHIIYEKNGSIEIRLDEIQINFLEGNNKTYKGSVAWENEKMDICLLKLNFSYQSPNISWGKVLREKSKSVECDGCGFPNAIQEIKNDQLHLYSAGMEGTIDLHAYVSNNLFAIALKHGYAPSEAKLWKGFSGTALFSGDYLIGVVISTLDSYEGERLTACPIEKILNKAENRATFSQYIGINLSNLIEINSLLIPPKPSSRLEIFFSYNEKDKEQIEKIKKFLSEQGFNLFSDKTTADPGFGGLSAVKQVLKKAKAAIIVFGEQGLESWQQQELLAVLQEQALLHQEIETSDTKPLPIIPILLPNAKENSHLKLVLNKFVNLKSGLENPTELNKLTNLIKEPSRNNPFIEVCPYKSLNSFQEEDELLFFGRERESQILLEKLENNNLVTVVGASGIGKSSIVRAGLLPLLRKTRSKWSSIIFTPFTPNKTPWFSLAKELLSLLNRNNHNVDTFVNEEINKYGEQLNLNSNGELQLHIVCEKILQKIEKDLLVIIIDQFEELFTLIRAEETKEFINSLLDITSNSISKIKLVLTLRADFYGKVIGFSPGLSDKVLQGQVNIPPMGLKDLRYVIEKPAINVGLRFEEGLVDKILEKIIEQPGSLALLEFALTELWSGRNAGSLTYNHYQKIDEVEGAISKRAEEVFSNLTSEEQKMTPQVLTRLVRVADAIEEETYTRQRIQMSELDERAKKIAYKFVEARLLVVSRDEIINQEILEVAHEALIKNWPRLQDLLKNDSKFLLWRQQLNLDIKRWHNANKDNAFLLRGSLLKEAKQYLSKRSKDLNELEKSLIKASYDKPKETFRSAVRIIVVILILATAIETIWSRTDFHQVNLIISEFPNMLLNSDRDTVGVFFGTLVVSNELDKALFFADTIQDEYLKDSVYNSIDKALVKLSEAEKSPKIANNIKDESLKANAYSLIAIELVRLGKTQEALKLIEEIPAKGSQFKANVYSSIVIGLAKSGKTEEALKLADNISAKGSLFKANAYSSIAIELARLGKTQEAINIADRILPEGSFFKANAYSSIAVELAKSGKTEEALKLAGNIKSGDGTSGLPFEEQAEFATELKEYISSGKVYSLIAIELARLEKTQEAISVADNIPPEDSLFKAKAYIAIAIELVKLHKTEEAIQLATSLEKDTPYSFNSIPIELAKLGKTQEAISVADNISDNTVKADAYLNIAIALAGLGKTQEAVNVAEKIKDSDHITKITAYNSIATELAKLGKTQEAVNVAEKIGDYYYSDTKAKTYIAMAIELAKLGNREALEQYLNIVLTKMSEIQDEKIQSSLLASIGIIQAKLGRFYEAKKTVEQKVLPNDQLKVYVVILQEYAIKQNPSLSKSFPQLSELQKEPEVPQ